MPVFIIVDESFHFIPVRDNVVQEFNISNIALSSSNTSEIMPETLKKWTRSTTLHLIDLKQKYETLFQSTTVKNEKVWAKICAQLAKQGIQCTVNQCRDRWKYLKQKYTEKKDNTKMTGAQRINFEFYDEMDALLGTKRNLNPIVASSLDSATALATGT